MPRKTKKRKLVAEYRRRMSVLSKPNVAAEPKQQKKVVTPVVAKVIPTEKIQTDTSHIIQDLKKTIVLSVLAVAIVLVIYFVTNS